MPAVRVIIVNYNSGEWLLKCLEALLNQTYPDFEAVIVDNASVDHSADVLPFDSRLTAIRMQHNLGFAAANNRAAQGSAARWLAFLNPDAIPNPDWLEQLVAEAESRPEYSIIGSTQIRASDPNVMDGTGDCLSAFGVAWRSNYGYPKPLILPEGEVFGACAAAMLIEQKLFERLGGFDQRFFCYTEDVDLNFRARLAGARCWQSSRAVVLHVGGGSAGQAQNPFAIYHGHRNLVWMHIKCMPALLLPIALIGYLGLAFCRIIQLPAGEIRHAYWRAAKDGFSGLGEFLRSRREIGKSRTVSWLDVARWLSWNPRDLRRRPLILLQPPASSRKRPMPLPRSPDTL